MRVRADGSQVDISLTVSPIRNVDGKIVAASAIARDMTEEKRAHEREMKLVQEQAARAEAERMAERLARIADEKTRLLQQADAINRAKSEFLAVMSHELRTPLNAIMGYTYLLEGEITGPINSAQRDQLDRIRRSGSHLRRLIDQVLIHAKLEAGKEEPEWQPVNLRELTRDVVQLMEPAAAEKHLELRCDLKDGIGLGMDPTYLRQVLLNLLSNAIKFTDEGRIVLQAVPDREQVEIRISDTGRGIPAEHLERIFEPFWQVEQGRTRSFEGTGLGLTVARRLTALLGGKLRADSKVGRGTVMTLRLPVRAGFNIS